MFPIANLTVGCKVKDPLLLHLMTDTIHILHNVCREMCRSQTLIPIMPLMWSDVTCLINVYYITSNKMQGKYLFNIIHN